MYYKQDLPLATNKTAALKFELVGLEVPPQACPSSVQKSFYLAKREHLFVAAEGSYERLSIGTITNGRGVPARAGEHRHVIILVFAWSNSTFILSSQDLSAIKFQHVFSSGGARKGFNIYPEGETIQAK